MANATTTTQKQSDYEVEQSSFPLIALFWLKLGRCRGQNWLNGSQALSQFRPRQRPILSQNKASSGKGDLLNDIIALFLCRGRGVCCKWKPGLIVLKCGLNALFLLPKSKHFISFYDDLFTLTSDKFRMVDKCRRESPP